MVQLYMMVYYKEIVHLLFLRFSLDNDVEKCNILFTNNSHKEDNVFTNATVMQFNNVKE